MTSREYTSRLLILMLVYANSGIMASCGLTAMLLNGEFSTRSIFELGAGVCVYLGTMMLHTKPKTD